MSLPRLLRSNITTRLTPPLRVKSLFPTAPLFTSRLRYYSIKTDEDALQMLPGVDPTKLVVTESITPKELIPHQELVFGQTFTGRSIDTPMCRRTRSDTML